MLTWLNSFLFIFFIGSLLDFLVFGFDIIHILIALIAALASSYFCYRIGIIRSSRELSFLYLNLYSIYIHRYFLNFFKLAISIHKPFLLNYSSEPVLYKTKISNFKTINLSILKVFINMHYGTSLLYCEDDVAYIYCIDDKDFSDLNMLRLTKDLKDINDNSLV